MISSTGSPVTIADRWTYLSDQMQQQAGRMTPIVNELSGQNITQVLDKAEELLTLFKENVLPLFSAEQNSLIEKNILQELNNLHQKVQDFIANLRVQIPLIFCGDKTAFTRELMDASSPLGGFLPVYHESVRNLSERAVALSEREKELKVTIQKTQDCCLEISGIGTLQGDIEDVKREFDALKSLYRHFTKIEALCTDIGSETIRSVYVIFNKNRITSIERLRGFTPLSPTLTNNQLNFGKDSGNF